MERAGMDTVPGLSHAGDSTLSEVRRNRRAARRSASANGLAPDLDGFRRVLSSRPFQRTTEHILESRGTIRSDNAIDAALASCRIEPFVSAFLWVRNLGSTPAILAAVIIATGFLWPQRGAQIVIALWLTCLGAVATTTVGRPLVGGHRTEFVPDVYAAGWSFQSGRATAAMAVYGFIAYAIARSLPGFRERFEVGYWAGILILLIGFSRIFLGVHYVTDVVGGFLVGASGC
jgi:PAP2 superfamily